MHYSKQILKLKTKQDYNNIEEYSLWSYLNLEISNKNKMHYKKTCQQPKLNTKTGNLFLIINLQQCNIHMNKYMTRKFMHISHHPEASINKMAD